MLLILTVVAVWGFNFVVIKIGLQDFSPLFLCASRFILASIPAVFFVKRPSIPFTQVLLYGLVMFALQFALLFVGMYEGIAPGLASLLLQVQVFFTAVLAHFFFGEKWTISKVLGALIAISGIILVGCNLRGNVTLLGFILVLLSAFTWSSGNVISKRIGKTNMLSLVIWASLVAWPPLLLLSLWIDGPEKILYSLTHITWASGGAVLYITYLSTLFGYASWSWLLHHHPLQSIAPFTLLVPVLAMLSSALVLKEPLQAWKAIAASLVISGLCVNIFGSKIFKKIRSKNKQPS